MPLYGPDFLAAGSWQWWTQGTWYPFWVYETYACLGYTDGVLICPEAEKSSWYRAEYATTVAGGGWRSVTINGHVWKRAWTCADMGSYGMNPYTQGSRRASAASPWELTRFHQIDGARTTNINSWMRSLGYGQTPIAFGGPDEKVLLIDAWDDLGGRYEGHYKMYTIDVRHDRGSTVNVLFVDGHYGKKRHDDMDFMWVLAPPATGYRTGSDFHRYWSNKTSCW